ncbi:hypothetical protein, partial [Escherichia coli]|uniref:hypothetical protein n=1 Tax=Escherichia coli TaxID=562 RepID=UPI002ED9984D
MQITEALISEPGDIRRFVQQAVDHWPNLLAFHFTLYSAEGNINGQQIHAFCTSFYRQVHERITERNHTACPSSPVVLRWLREQHGGATIRCLLLLSQTSICHPRASATVDEECSQRVDLLQQGTVAKLAMRQPFVLFKGLTFQKLCLPGAFRPGDHHNK